MMGELKFFLGLQIKQTEDKTFIHQSKYVRELLKRFKLDEAKPVSTPMHPTTSLGLDKESNPVIITEYRQMIGSLLYLTASRSDIMFSVCLCTRFQADPREVHLSAIKRIFSDADYAGDKVERKSTRGGCHFMWGNLISWMSKKQRTIALSTAEAEYISTAQCCSQLLWIRNQLAHYEILENNIPIFCDNNAAISLSKNPILHSRAKHIEIKHHFIRDHVQKGTIDLQFVSTDEQLTNIFTKTP